MKGDATDQRSASTATAREHLASRREDLDSARDSAGSERACSTISRKEAFCCSSEARASEKPGSSARVGGFKTSSGSRAPGFTRDSTDGPEPSTSLTVCKISLGASLGALVLSMVGSFLLLHGCAAGLAVCVVSAVLALACGVWAFLLAWKS